MRHKSGRYYARPFLNGKEIWKSLKTSHFSVAEAIHHLVGGSARGGVEVAYR